MSQKDIIGGRFEIGEPIGSGGMGTVYKGVDLQTNNPVAIKALTHEVISSEPSLLTRFEREGQALRILNHPNIVKVLATISEKNNHYLVMEYVGGGSLAEVIRQEQQLPVKQVLRYALGVADALAKTHTLDIVHRDIKPANILLTEGGTPRLTDFGVAHTVNSKLTQTGTTLGTLPYLSPEAFQDFELDARTDIWSFGVTLFELLTGGRPFRGETLALMMDAVLTQPIPDLEKLRPKTPVALVDLIYRMLEKNREARIPNVRLVGAELEDILQSLPATSPNLQVAAHIALPDVDEASRFEIPPTRVTIRHNLPHQIKKFIGRQRELRDLNRLMSKHRLVTIIGPAGSGKTRFALEVAQQHIDEYAHGVFYIPLVPVSNPDYIIPVIANSVGYTFSTGHDEARDQRMQLLDYLRYKYMLLIFDNFEQIIASLRIIKDILNIAHNVQILIVSQDRLQLRGEKSIVLEGLDYRRWRRVRIAFEYGAAQFFVDRVQQFQPTWQLVEEDLPYLYTVCDLVNGMPLAIEIAATLMNRLSLKEIAWGLTNNLDFLSVDMEHLPDRQRRMRAIIELAWDRLKPVEKDALTELTIFRGGFMRDAAQEVTNASLQVLKSLVEKSLLYREPMGRYEMHEVVHQFVEQTIKDYSPEIKAARDRHSAHYADFMRRRRFDLRGHRQRKTLQEIETEIENVRQAWLWAAIQGNYAELAKMVDPLSQFYLLQNRFMEGREIFTAAVEALVSHKDEDQVHVKGKILARQGAFLAANEQYEVARHVLRNSLQIAQQINNAVDNAWSLYWLGELSRTQGEYKDSIEIFEYSLMLSQQNNERFLIVRIYNSLSIVYSILGDWAAFQKLHRDSLTLAREIHDRVGEMEAWQILALLASEHGDYDTAEDGFEQVLQFYRKTGDQPRMARSHFDLGRNNLLQSKLTHAKHHLNESVTLSLSMHDFITLALALATQSIVATLQKDYDLAMQLAKENSFIVDLTRDSLGELYGTISMAHVLCEAGDVETARPSMINALRLIEPDSHILLKLVLLIDFAWHYAAQGSIEQAARLFAACLSYPTVQMWILHDTGLRKLQNLLKAALATAENYAIINGNEPVELNPLIGELVLEFAKTR